MAWVWLFYMHSVCARAPYLLVNNKARNNIPYYIQCGSFFPCSVFSAFQIKRTINICIFLKIEYFLEMGKRNWKKRSKNVAKLYKYRSSVCEITVSTGGLYVNQAPDSSYHSDKQLQSWPSVRAAPDSKWLSYIRFGKLKCSSASIWFQNLFLWSVKTNRHSFIIWAIHFISGKTNIELLWISLYFVLILILINMKMFLTV